MRDDEDSLPRLQAWLDLGLVVRDEALHDILQALGARNLRQVGVAHVVGLRVLAIHVDLRRRGVVAAAPGHELLFAVLIAGLGLVQALQRTVVALVEAPVALHRDPVAVRLVQRDIRGHDRAAQQRGEQDGRLDSRVPNQLAGPLGLGLALVGEADVHPPGELVRCVPFALPVAEEDQCSFSVAHTSILP